MVLDYLSDRESMLHRNQKLRNPEAVMRMLYALTGDIVYQESIEFMKEDGGKTMCDLLDEMKNQGRQEGRQEGIQQGIQVLVSACRELGVGFAETAAKLKEKYSLTEGEVQRDMKLYW